MKSSRLRSLVNVRESTGTLNFGRSGVEKGPNQYRSRVSDFIESSQSMCAHVKSNGKNQTMEPLRTLLLGIDTA
jgi:hypothetical protein